MRLSADNLQALMLMAGVGLMCWLMLRGRLKRRRHAVLPVMTQPSSARELPGLAFRGTQSAGAPAEVLRWQVELHDLGRELKAELDCKLVAVRSLTLSYDQAARRLAEMIRLAEQVSAGVGCPLVEARRLSGLGWEPSRIAVALGMPQREIEQLLIADEDSLANQLPN